MSIDWSKLYKKYKGLWVALKQDEQTVIASGKTAKEAWEKAINEGYAKPVLNHVPEELVYYVGIWLRNLSTKSTARTFCGPSSLLRLYTRDGLFSMKSSLTPELTCASLMPR